MFRLSKAKYRLETMSGEGALAFGGRWNSPGTRVVYTSGNLSLCTLELLVHLDDADSARQLSFVYHHVRFPLSALTMVSEEDLPDAWDSHPESTASQVVGDEWVASQASVALAVPSVLTPKRHRFSLEYMNVLVNPRHPDFDAVVEVGELHDLDLDPRLLGGPGRLGGRAR